VVPVSISNGVIVASFGDGLETDGKPRRLDPGRRRLRKTLLGLCCTKRAFGYVRVTVGKAM
jgi:hypothetical protein